MQVIDLSFTTSNPESGPRFDSGPRHRKVVVVGFDSLVPEFSSEVVLGVFLGVSISV